MRYYDNYPASLKDEMIERGTEHVKVSKANIIATCISIGIFMITAIAWFSFIAYIAFYS